MPVIHQLKTFWMKVFKKAIFQIANYEFLKKDKMPKKIFGTRRMK